MASIFIYQCDFIFFHQLQSFHSFCKIHCGAQTTKACPKDNDAFFRHTIIIEHSRYNITMMRYLRKTDTAMLRGVALLRLDFNTEDDWRMRAVLPTIKFLLK